MWLIKIPDWTQNYHFTIHLFCALSWCILWKVCPHDQTPADNLCGAVSQILWQCQGHFKVGREWGKCHSLTDGPTPLKQCLLWHRTGYSVGHQARRTWWIIVQNCSNEFPLLQHRQMVHNGNLLVSGKVFASPTYALIYIDCKCHHFAATILKHSSMSSHIGFWHFENISTWKDSSRNIWWFMMGKQMTKRR